MCREATEQKAEAARWRVILHIHKKKAASLTVEASLIVPLVLVLFLPFLYVIRSVYVYDCVETAVCETVRQMEPLLYLAEKTDQPEGETGDTAEQEEIDSNTETAVGDMLQNYRSFSSLLKSFQHGSGAKALTQQAVLQQLAKDLTARLLERHNLEDWGLKNGLDGISYSLSEFFFDEGSRKSLFAITVCYELDYKPSAPVYIRTTGRSYTGQDTIGQTVQGSTAEENETEWYRLGSGTHYHTRDCYLIAKDVFSLSKEEAVQRGYAACSSCASRTGSTVWVTEGGECYHCEGCRYIQPELTPVTKEDIEREGLLPCRICIGGGEWFS